MGGRVRALRPQTRQSRTLWMVGQVGTELQRFRAALFHGVANFDLPLCKPSGVRFVLTVHDLIPLEWPETVSVAYRVQFRVWLERSLALADAVICPTRAVADGLQERFRPRAPVRVIPMGVDGRDGLPRDRGDQRYFLILGTLETRKNVSTVVRAFQTGTGEAWREGVELWIAGGLGFGSGPELQAIAVVPGVRYLGSQPPREVRRLLRGALALCAPSLAEGFGMPPLEAMAVGTPVIASDIPAHREVLGEGALLVSPRDEEGWATAMAQTAAEAGFRDRLAASGLERAAVFSWARTAAETEELYRAVLGER